MNVVDTSANKNQASIQEQQETESEQIGDIIDEVEGLSEDERAGYIEEFNEISDRTSPREFVEALKDERNCR